MSETIESTATTVKEVPVKKRRLTTKTKILIATAATTVAAGAAVIFLNRENDDIETETDYNPATVETLSDLIDRTES